MRRQERLGPSPGLTRKGRAPSPLTFRVSMVKPGRDPLSIS